MSEWREVKLGNIVTSNNQSIGKNYEYETIQYLDTGSITNGKIEGYQKVKISDAPSRAKRLVKHEDIIYSTVRPIQRHFGFIENPINTLVVSTGFSVIEVNNDLANPKFIYYFLSSNETVEILNVIAEASTTTYPSLKPKDIKNLDILLPPLKEQKEIAEVLSSLDDKIDLLHYQNKTLEGLAQTLFRQWFVEEAGDEWEMVELGSVIETTSGGTPSRKKMEYYKNGKYFWVKSKELNGSFLTETEEQITEEALQNSSAKLLPKNSILIAMYGATVGEYTIISENMTCNQAICALKPNENYPYTFLYMFVKNYKEEIINMAVGSAQQNISQLLIKQLPIHSNIKIISKFHKEVELLFEKIKSSIEQIKTLENTRDTLLPKLMSGEVRVKF